MSGFDQYHADVAAARRIGFSLTAEGEAELLELLAEFAEDLARLVRDGSASGSQRRLHRQVQELYRELSATVQERTESGVRLTAQEVAGAHARAAVGLLGGTGVSVGTAFRGVGTAAAQAVIARPQFTRAIKSLRTGGAEAANRIIARGFLRGVPNRVIERELRIHVGAPDSLLQGDRRLLFDLRRISYDTIEELGYPRDRAVLLQVRGEAGALRDRGTLVVRAERANAEQEAHARSVAESPVVMGVKVAVSGRHGRRDQCDVAAEEDLFGLGRGVYPKDRVPARFHPRCLCRFTHVLLPAHLWGTDVAFQQSEPFRGSWKALAERTGLSPSQTKALRAAIRIGDARTREGGARAAA